MSHAHEPGPPGGGYYLASQAVKTKGLRKPQPRQHPPTPCRPQSWHWKILSPLCPSPSRASGADGKFPPSLESLPISVPPRLLPAWPPVNQNTPSYLGGGGGRSELPAPQDAWTQSLPSLRELGEKRPSQDGRSDLWGSLGTGCVRLPEFPWKGPRALEWEWEGGLGTPADLGQASPPTWRGLELRLRISAREGLEAWGPGHTAAGASLGSPQEQGPFWPAGWHSG